MSAAANLVYKNFSWRISSIDPTATTIQRDYFAEIDPRQRGGRDPGTSSGLTRAFTVAWSGAQLEGDIGDGAMCVDDGTNRTAVHEFVVEVYYSPKLPWAELHALILSDRHDLIKALRVQSSFVGYDASNTTTDIGLYDRYRVSDELERESDNATFWTLRQIWRCLINETE